MSMSNENLHTAVDTLSVIGQSSLVYWQKYITGANLTYFDCPTKPSVTCLPPKPNNVVRLLGHVKHIEYVATADTDPESCYYSSLIVPIFQQLAKRVNLTLELFVSRSDTQVEQLIAIERNLSTAVDSVPYIYATESRVPATTCAPPMYLINQLQLLTARTVERNSLEDMFQVFSFTIWSIILFFFLTCVTLDQLLGRRPLGLSSLWNSLVNYFKTLLSKESQTNQYNRLLFIFWTLGCIPLVEIFRNDMIAKIVENKYRYINSIEDLLETKLNGLATAGDLSAWNDSNFLSPDQVEYESVRDRYQQLFQRTQPMLFNDPKWLDLFNDPRELIAVIRSSAILEDEFAIKFFASVLGEILPVHISRESYFPQYVSPICYIESFPYARQLEGLTRELFEKGFLWHWDNLKHRYYGVFGKRIFKLLAGDDVLDRLNVELDQANEQQTMSNLFGYILQLYIVLTVVNCLAFAGELATYYLIGCRGQKLTNNASDNGRLLNRSFVQHSSLSH